MKKRNYTITGSIICLIFFLSANHISTFGKPLTPGFDTIAPTITLNGSNDTMIEVFYPFNDPGVSVHDNYWPDSTLIIDKAGFVDTTKLGSYNIKYSATDSSGNGPVSVTRTVRVVDTVAPVVDSATYLGKQVYNGDTLLLNLFYKFPELLLSMTDNYYDSVTLHKDGDYYNWFPDGIASQCGIYSINYLPTDSSGNSSLFIIYIKIADSNAPSIKLIGAADTTLEVNNNFNDPGVSIHHDIWLESKINVNRTGIINTNILGTYNLSYTATDPCNNISNIVTRTVHVVDSTNSINSLFKGNVKIFPNPNQGKFIINISGTELQNINLIIFNSLGEVLQQMSKKDFIKGRLEINLKNFSPGIYFVKIETNMGSVIKKVNLIF